MSELENNFISHSYNITDGENKKNITNIFVESKNIKVFPCTYRGYYNTTETLETIVFDPEARSTTEANFTTTFHKLSSTKDSYVVS
jgi:hypothetical protein